MGGGNHLYSRSEETRKYGRLTGGEVTCHFGNSLAADTGSTVEEGRVLVDPCLYRLHSFAHVRARVGWQSLAI